MKRKILKWTLAAAVVSALVTSCPSAVSRSGDSGVVAVRLAASSSRDVLTAPVFPVLSSATVTVTGSDMTPISATIVNGAVSLEVPEGKARVVTVDAVPDWGATAAANPSAVLPRAALRYGGTATVDVTGGRTTQVAISLGMTASKIVLPSASTYSLYLADSFAGVSSVTNYVSFNVGQESDFEPDQYGRVYMTTEDAAVASPTGVVVYRNDGGDLETSPIGIIDNPETPISRIAPDGVRGRLYVAGDDGSTDGQIGFYDASGIGYVNFNQPSNLPGNWKTYNADTAVNLYPCITTDRSGYVYVLAYSVEENTNYVAKVSVGAPYYSAAQAKYVADITVLSKTPYASAGLMYSYPSAGNLRVEDMIVIGDTLYIAADQINFPSYSRGKIVALRASDLGLIGTVGWCGDTNQIITDSASQLCGPDRFIGVSPNKLYVADDGISAPYSNLNRVVEITLDTLSISGIRSVPAGVTFFREYYP
jgi:hypothetical protein